MSNLENTGVHSPAEAGGMAMAALEMLKGGASIEEVNDKFFGTDNGPSASAPDDVSDVAADGVTYEDDNAGIEKRTVEDGAPYNADDSNTPSQNGAESDVNRATDDDYDFTGAATDEEKLFSQKELDNFVGRRIAKERRAHDTVKADLAHVLDEVSKFLGVSREEALSAIERANYKKEAEENNVSDVDIYERLKIAEKKNSEYENAERNRVEAQNVEDFKSAISAQIEKLSGVIKESDLFAVSADNEFNSLVRYFYDNEFTRGDCVSLAYNAYARSRGNVDIPTQAISKAAPSDEGVRPASKGVAPQADANDNAASKYKPRRVSENASNTGAAASDVHPDPGKLTPEERRKFIERARSGETITF